MHMQCEICGADIRGRPFLIKVERSELNACSRCSRFGTPVESYEPARGRGYAAPPSGRPIARPRTRRRDVFDQMVDEVVPNYGEVIRREREKRSWSQEELALRILEKANVIRKIEREELMLEDDVRKKLEKALEIKLAEPVESTEVKRRGLSKDLTLGDIATIKKKK